jgi:aminoglycoside phosphotransferase (APT) family kinase protein
MIGAMGFDAATGLGALAADLGSGLVSAEPAPWGDSAATFRVRLSDGRIVSARLLGGPEAIGRAGVIAQRIERFHVAGIPTAHPAQVFPAPAGGAWVVCPWLEGRLGSASLENPADAVRLATRMGALSTRIAAIDPDGLPLDRTWSRRVALLSAAAAWSAAVDDALDPALRGAVGSAIDRLGTSWTDDRPWEPVVAHGDFVPINVVDAPSGGLLLLDLEDVALAPRLFDLAWWGWVVRFHHPDAWTSSWPALLEGAGLTRDAALDEAAVLMARVRCLERAARLPPGPGRDRWLDRLKVTTDW